VLTESYNLAVPLVVVFTKFDGQIINEYVNLMDPYIKGKWEMARSNAEHTFREVYLPKVLDTKYPPKTYVRLEGEKANTSPLSDIHR
jgi:hypothetical protein